MAHVHNTSQFVFVRFYFYTYLAPSISWSPMSYYLPFIFLFIYILCLNIHPLSFCHNPFHSIPLFCFITFLYISLFILELDIASWCVTSYYQRTWNLSDYLPTLSNHKCQYGSIGSTLFTRKYCSFQTSEILFVQRN